jgi:predicted ATP-grasp superfamily ATP-dependent carboligase
LIVLAGIPSEPPLALLRQRLEETDSKKVIVFNQRKFEQMDIKFDIENGEIRGELDIENNRYDIDEIESVYLRLMDENFLPEIEKEPMGSQKRIKCRKVHEIFYLFCEVTPIRVVNKIHSMSSNSSKPYQMQLIRKYGFAIPETLITNNPKKVIEFKQQHKKVVYKSISSARSIVQELKSDDLNRLHLISWCPVQFQEFIKGLDVRVHVIGTKYFATAVHTDFTDYRYSHSYGHDVELKAYDLDKETAEKCIKLTEALGLSFSGIDLRITPDNRVFCFEINPSPGYSYFEANTGQQISKALAEYLAHSY